MLSSMLDSVWIAVHRVFTHGDTSNYFDGGLRAVVVLTLVLDQILTLVAQPRARHR